MKPKRSQHSVKMQPKTFWNAYRLKHFFCQKSRPDKSNSGFFHFHSIFETFFGPLCKAMCAVIFLKPIKGSSGFCKNSPLSVWLVFDFLGGNNASFEVLIHSSVSKPQRKKKSGTSFNGLQARRIMSSFCLTLLDITIDDPTCNAQKHD